MAIRAPDGANEQYSNKKTKNLTSSTFIYHSVYTLYLLYIFLLLNLQPDDTIDLNANQQFWSVIGQWPSPFSHTICGWLSVHGHIFQGAKIVKRGTEVSENSQSREFSMRVSLLLAYLYVFQMIICFWIIELLLSIHCSVFMKSAMTDNLLVGIWQDDILSLTSWWYQVGINQMRMFSN